LNNEVLETQASLPDRLECPRRKAFREHPLSDEMLLYASDREAAFSLNASAKAIWELCDGRHTLTDICRELGERFQCSQDQLLADVQQAVRRLGELGLLEGESSSGTTSSQG